MTILTEDQIERTIERLTNSNDAKYMKEKITTKEYEETCEKINQWAENEYKKMKAFRVSL